MNIEVVDKILDMILENEEIENIDLIIQQRKKLVIDAVEDSKNNKYFIFKFNGNVESIDTSKFGVISVDFLEKSHGIGIDCVLFFENGYIKSLEIYSVCGSDFENIDISNIEIQGRSPNTQH